MLETPEFNNERKQQETKGKSMFDYLKRYREAHRKLLARADSLKGKDEPRRRDLLKKAADMKKKIMTTDQVKRSAALAELDLLIDSCKHEGKIKNAGKK